MDPGAGRAGPESAGRRTDERIIGHLTLCFIAYYCEAMMTQALRKKKLMLDSPAIDEDTIDPRPLTVVEAMKELQEVRAVPVKVHSTTMWVRTDICGNAHKLLSAIGLKPPPKILRLIKISHRSTGTLLSFFPALMTGHASLTAWMIKFLPGPYLCGALSVF